MKSFGIKGHGTVVAMLFVALFVLAGASGVAAALDPLGQVKESVDSILALLQNDELRQETRREERRKKVVGIVEQRFDFREMSQRALAKYWKERTKQEQDDFVVLFKKVLENTYIGKIDEYSGEQIFFTNQEVRGNKAIVYSHFIRNNIETPVVYRLTQETSEWKVYDVIVEGVSLVQNYRTQFEDIIEKEKYAGLVVRLEEKASQMDKAGGFGKAEVSK